MWSPSQAAAQREAKRRPVFYTYPNLWPLVAVLVVLLCIFMVNAPPIVDGIGPDWPSALHATPQPRGEAEDAMKIYLMRDGRVFFRDYRVLPESLPFLIRNAMQEGAEKKVYLAVDARARYGDATAVVEQIGNAGIRELCILTNKREE